MLSTSSSASKGSPDSERDEQDGARLPVVAAGEPSFDGLSETEKAAIDDIVLHAREEYTEQQYKRVLRKQDFLLLPLMWLCYGTQQADKTSVATQATFGLRTDLNMTGQQYPWLTTIFYLSYLVAEPFSNYLMQRFSINQTLGTMMILWGVVVGAIAASQNWATVMALRALQGALESSISPAFLIITASYWKTEEHSLRALIWGTSNSGMGIITALGMYGIARRAQDHEGGLAPWRAISLFLGPLTVTLGILAFLFLGTPRESLLLRTEEKRIAQARVVASRTGTDRLKRKWDWEQFRETFRDPVVYIFFFLVLINALPNGGTTSFGNLIFVSFGFDPLETILKGIIPQNVLGIAWFLTVGILTRKFRRIRFIMMMASLVPSFVGTLCISLLPKTPDYRWPKYGCYLITVTGTVTGLMIWSIAISNVAGRTKKSVVSTSLFIAYCVGNSIGAQLFRAEWAPNYLPAIGISSGFYALEFIMMFCFRLYYVRINRRRAKVIEQRGMCEEEVKREGEILAERDTPDHLNPYFVYDI